MTLTEKFEKNIDQVNSDFQAIKSKLIECGVEVAEGTRTAEFADKVGQVYESGRKAENDAFWDAALPANIIVTAYWFAGVAWNDKTFNPPRDIIVTSVANASNSIFYNSGISDLAAILTRNDVWLDYSNAPTMGLSQFAQGAFTHIGRIKFNPNVGRYGSTFADCKNLHTIDELYFAPTTTIGSTLFNGCVNLVNLTITGTLATNGFDVSPCTKLSKESITSIIKALSDTTSGLTVTLSQTAINNAFTTDEWNALVATKKNWTISLV